MEKLTLQCLGLQKEIEIERKKIKNIHLKVFRDMSVKLSIPADVSNEWVNKFLLDKTQWIEKQLNKYDRSLGYNNLSEIKSGSSTQMFGKDLRVLVVKGKKGIVRDEKTVTISISKENDFKQINTMFEIWWREVAEQTYNEVVDKLIVIFTKHNIKKPYIAIKKMKTLWGSCNKVKNKITINEYLLKADLRCIEYVVLHELTHLLHNGHNKNFYDFLTIYMPDWKDRKKELDIEVVQGL